MMHFDHPNPDVVAVVDHLRCGRCGTRRGGGLVVNVDKLEPRKYSLRTRCLRCGAWVHATLEVDALEPGEVDPRAVRELDPISSDELLDLRSMPNETFAHEWAELTGGSK